MLFANEANLNSVSKDSEIIYMYFTERKHLTLKPSIYIFIDLSVFLQSEQNIVASFDRKGEYIYTGNSKGKVSDDVVTNKRCGVSVAEFRF